MSSAAGTIDGFSFARTGGRVGGLLLQADVTRLAEATASVEAIEYAIEGVTNALGKPALRVRAVGRIGMQCQRCLEPVPTTIEVDQELELAATQSAIDTAQDDVDRVLATRTMDVGVIVEDELLLALPMVACHEGCSAPAMN